jgi:hypothetical protein
MERHEYRHGPFDCAHHTGGMNCGLPAADEVHTSTAPEAITSKYQRYTDAEIADEIDYHHSPDDTDPLACDGCGRAWPCFYAVAAQRLLATTAPAYSNVLEEVASSGPCDRPACAQINAWYVQAEAKIRRLEAVRSRVAHDVDPDALVLLVADFDAALAPVAGDTEEGTP